MNKSEDKPDMRILKTSSCKSITGKSSLTYQVGATPDDDIYIRITKNTGAGQFSDEWIKVEDIQKALAEGHKGEPLTSFLLQTLFKGRSVNTPAFIMAALTQEKLLCALKGKKRGHEFLDPEGFDSRMQKLVSGKGTTSRAKKKAPVRKAPSKKRAVARKKAAKTT